MRIARCKTWGRMSSALLVVLVLFPASESIAEFGFVAQWQNQYMNSLSDDNVFNGTGTHCQLCHVALFGGSDNFNGYGWDVRSQLNTGLPIQQALVAVQGFDSDMNPRASSNFAEINADAQPGWREGLNIVYDDNGNTSEGSAPIGIGLLDPLPATQPDIDVIPAALDFGSVTIGSSASSTAEVRNLGTADLVVQNIHLCSGTSSEYTWSPAAPFTVVPGGSIVLSVTYTPTDTGVDSGCLEILSNDPDEPSATLDVTGSGAAAPEPDINLQPPQLGFGTVVLGNVLALTSTVQNLGDAALAVTMIQRCTGTSAEFTWMPATFNVAPGGSETITVTYAPTAAGNDTGCLRLISNDPDENPSVLNLAGTGEAPPPNEPDINLAPPQLDFGTLLVGNVLALTSMVQNLGDAPLGVTMIQRCAGTSAEFTWTPTTFNLAPGGSEPITVSYTPSGVGTDTGCLQLSSNDPDEDPAVLNLTGAGELPPVNEPDVHLEPGLLDFGAVLVGDSISLTTEVQNLGNVTLDVTLVDRCSNTSTEFAWTPDTITVPPNSSQPLEVTYTPMGTGNDAGCLQVSSNDPDEPIVQLALMANGIDALVDLDIAGFRVTKRIGCTSPIRIQLKVRNAGAVNQARRATVVGVQNGQIVYEKSMMVSDDLGGPPSSYTFPPYVPTGIGHIEFTATIEDNDPDMDEATAMSKVIAPCVNNKKKKTR